MQYNDKWANNRQNLKMSKLAENFQTNHQKEENRIYRQNKRLKSKLEP